MEVEGSKYCVKMDTNEDHLAYAMQVVTSTSLAMVLVNAFKLKVFETIAKAGPDVRLSAHEIASRLSIQNQDAPDMLDRMLRLLTSHSIITCTQRDEDSKLVRTYGLNAVSKFFVPNEDGASLGPFMELLQDKVFIDSWFKLNDAVVEGGNPFTKVHKAAEFDYISVDTKFNKVFNTAMVNHSTIMMKRVLECYNGFDNINSMVDVAGNLGITLNMIISKHPNIKGINFDLPHVIRYAPSYPGIQHIAGDMFQGVPRADAIFMKKILHDWGDDECIKLLKHCYKALPDDGKVIAVDAILPFLPDTSSSMKINANMDVLMMAQSTTGRERTEDEFLALAKGAGFAGMRKKCFICNFWVMEFYK